MQGNAHKKRNAKNEGGQDREECGLAEMSVKVNPPEGFLCGTRVPPRSGSFDESRRGELQGAAGKVKLGPRFVISVEAGPVPGMAGPFFPKK